MAKNKRTLLQIEVDRSFVEHHHLRGKTTREIATMLNAERSYSLSYQQICYDLQAVYDQWKSARLKDRDDHVTRELEAIRRQEDELWQAWEKSKQDAVKTVQEQQSGKDKGKGGMKAQVTKEHQCGDPRFMDSVIRLRQQKIELLGLDTPTKVEVTGADGGPIKVSTREALEKVYGDRALSG